MSSFHLPSLTFLSSLLSLTRLHPYTHVPHLLNLTLVSHTFPSSSSSSNHFLSSSFSWFARHSHLPISSLSSSNDPVAPLPRSDSLVMSDSSSHSPRSPHRPHSPMGIDTPPQPLAASDEPTAPSTIPRPDHPDDTTSPHVGPSPNTPFPITPSTASPPRYTAKQKGKGRARDASPPSSSPPDETMNREVSLRKLARLRQKNMSEFGGSYEMSIDPRLLTNPGTSKAAEEWHPASGSLLMSVTGSSYHPSSSGPAPPLQSAMPSEPPMSPPELPPLSPESKPPPSPRKRAHATSADAPLGPSSALAAGVKTDPAYLNDRLVIAPTRGVTVFRESNYTTGETVVQTTPLYPCLHSGLLASHCAGCFMPSNMKANQLGVSLEEAARRYLKCSRCGVVQYCSVVCDRAWGE